MSSEPPKPNPEKIKSVPEAGRARPRIRAVGLFVLALVIIALIAIGIALLVGRPSTSTKTITLGQGASAQSYALERVTSADALERGLSGRAGLGANSGMLFDYGSANQRCIWMKDMKFNIDVIWLNTEGRIVSAVAKMTPSSYPQTYCAQASQVIELPEGTIKAQGLRPGQTLDI